MKDTIDRERVAELLSEAVAAQTAFWDALKALEDEIGADLESTIDLEGYDVETLLEIANEESEDES